MRGFGRQIVHAVGIGGDVVELLDRPRRTREPRGTGRQRPRRACRPEFSGDRHAVGVGRQVVPVQPRQKVPHVPQPPLAHGAPETRDGIHAVAGADDDPGLSRVGPEDAVALHPIGNRHARKVERGGAEVEQAHERVARRADRRVTRPVREP